MNNATQHTESGSSPPRRPDDICKAYTPESLAALWSEPWTPAMIRSLCRAGRIPARRAGKYWLISAAALADWLAETGRPKPPRAKPTLSPYKIVVRKS
jgi:hypothetical protein